MNDTPASSTPQPGRRQWLGHLAGAAVSTVAAAAMTSRTASAASARCGPCHAVRAGHRRRRARPHRADAGVAAFARDPRWTTVLPPGHERLPGPY
ncbi:hypothetical protein ACTMU2_01665 [Cupriavidus basilensis]